MKERNQHGPDTDAVGPVDLSGLPEPTEPEEILGTKAASEKAASEDNPFTGNLWRLPELLQREFTEDWVIDGLFCRGDLVALYGPAKSAKTFLALDMAMSAATGQVWCSNRFAVPKVRTIVYCAGEGIRGLRRRWQSVSSYYSAEHKAMSRIITVPLVPQLFEDGIAPGGVSQFISAIREGMPDEQVDLIVIDTLNRASVGANENSAQDIGVILAHCTQIQKETGAAVIFDHPYGFYKKGNGYQLECIVTHAYQYFDSYIREMEHLCAKLGLHYEILPRSESWYRQGATFMIVMTRAEKTNAQ